MKSPNIVGGMAGVKGVDRGATGVPRKRGTRFRGFTGGGTPKRAKRTIRREATPFLFFIIYSFVRYYVLHRFARIIKLRFEKYGIYRFIGIKRDPFKRLGKSVARD